MKDRAILILFYMSRISNAFQIHPIPSHPSITTTASTTTATNMITKSLPPFVAGLTTATTSVLALEDDIEIAELPPVWVPIVFAIAIMVGSGLLTMSLGDVYNEESLLGMQSGARAKKERERSRSSYFKRSD